MVVVLFSKECHRCHPSEGVSEILREREREGGRKRGKERERVVSLSSAGRGAAREALKELPAVLQNMPKSCVKEKDEGVLSRQRARAL